MKQGKVKGAATEEQRQQLSADLFVMIDDAETAKGSLPDRWAHIEAIYNLEEYERSYMPHEDAACFALPLMTSRIDAKEASVTGPMLSARPYFTAISSGESARYTDCVENAVHWSLDQALWPEQLLLGVHIAMLTGVTIFRAWFDARMKGLTDDTPDLQTYGSDDPEIDYAAIRIDTIHPKDFISYPLMSYKVARSRMIGHREYMRRGEVEAKQKRGEWFDDAPLSEGIVEIAGKSETFARTSLQTTSIADDQPITIYYLTVKLDLDGNGEQWFEVAYAYDTRQILEIVPYKWSRPGYFAPSFKKEYRTMFPALSPAKKIEGPAMVYNELFNEYIDGVQMASAPPTFYNPETGSTTDQSTQYKPGELIATTGAPQVASVASVFKGESFPSLLQQVQDIADQGVSLPVTAVGGQYQSGTTATAADQSAAAQATSQNALLTAFAGGECAAMAAFIHEMITANADLLKMIYGDAAPWEDSSELDIKCTWEVTGKSPNAFGPALVQNLKAAAEIFEGIGIGHMLDKKALGQSILTALDLPAGTRVMLSDEEIAMAEQQMQEAQMLAMMNAGAPPIPQEMPVG